MIPAIVVKHLNGHYEWSHRGYLIGYPPEQNCMVNVYFKLSLEVFQTDKKKQKNYSVNYL